MTRLQLVMFWFGAGQSERFRRWVGGVWQAREYHARLIDRRGYVAYVQWAFVGASVVLPRAWMLP